MGSSPGWVTGFVPTATQWNDTFAGKQDQQAASIAKATSFTATAFNIYLVDCSSGSISATLPLSPLKDDLVTLIDGTGFCGTNPLSVPLNGSTYLGGSTPPSITTNWGWLKLLYTGATWVQAP